MSGKYALIVNPRFSVEDGQVKSSWCEMYYFPVELLSKDELEFLKATEGMKCSRLVRYINKHREQSKKKPHWRFSFI